MRSFCNHRLLSARRQPWRETVGIFLRQYFVLFCFWPLIQLIFTEAQLYPRCWKLQNPCSRQSSQANVGDKLVKMHLDSKMPSAGVGAGGAPGSDKEAPPPAQPRWPQGCSYGAGGMVPVPTGAQEPPWIVFYLHCDFKNQKDLRTTSLQFYLAHKPFIIH